MPGFKFQQGDIWYFAHPYDSFKFSNFLILGIHNPLQDIQMNGE